MRAARLNRADETLTGLLQQLAVHPLPDSVEDTDGMALEPVSDLIDAIIRHVQTDTVAELMADAVEADLFSVERAVEFIQIGVYCGRGGGGNLCSTLDRWMIQGTDPIRIEIALSVDVSLLMGGSTRLFAKLEEIASRFPHLAPHCSQYRAWVSQPRTWIHFPIDPHSSSSEVILISAPIDPDHYLAPIRQFPY